MNINFLIIAWRGFSGNNGKPTEQGLYEDGKSAIHWLVKKGSERKKSCFIWRIFRNWCSHTFGSK